MVKLLLIGIMALWSASAASQTIVSIDFDTCINAHYIGNGMEWDPYQMDYGHGRMTLPQKEWDKIYRRLDFMRPQLVRVVHNTAELMHAGQLNPMDNFNEVKPILDYCQSHDITVIFGDWGWGLADTVSFDRRKVEMAADYVTWLIKEKGYTCIKYYNLINEPNGYWSLTRGHYEMWRDMTRCFYNRLRKLKMLSRVRLVGADLAIWKSDYVWWQQRMTDDLDVALYDIHTYPSKKTVNSGEYGRIIRHYRDAVPDGHAIVMGEVGLKFVDPADSLYLQESQRRAASLPYASLEDSQMFIFDYMYGTDMADILMQTANNGFSGCVAWMLDDAMHSAEKPDKLKMWGFWNIFGDEFFGHEQEKVRPWFYAWSLLTRYMPAGCSVCSSAVNGNPSVKALSVEKDGHRMIAVLNVSKRPQKVMLKGNTSLRDCQRFDYAEGKLRMSDRHILEPNERHVCLDLRKGFAVGMPGESMTLFTDFNY